MQRKSLAIFALILTALVTAWRVLMLPAAAGDGKTLTHLNVPLFAVLLAAALLLLFLGRSKHPHAALSGRDARVVALGGVLFSAALAATSAVDLVRWIFWRVAPPPAVSPVAQKTDNTLLSAMLLLGIVSAVFLCAYFLHSADGAKPLGSAGAAITAIVGAVSGAAVIVLAVRFFKDTPALSAEAEKRKLLLGMLAAVAIGVVLIVAFVRWYLRREWGTNWLWLLPSLWMFVRLARYNVLYATAVDVTPLAYDAVLYCVALLFLFALGCYMSGVRRPTRFLRGLAAATAALALSAVLSRGILLCMGLSEAAAYCALPNGADAMLGVFALTVAASLPSGQPEEVAENS